MDELRCPNCGVYNRPGSEVCHECGAPLAPGTDMAYRPPPYPPPVQTKKGISGWSSGKKIGLSLVIILILAVAGYVGYRVIKTVTYPDLKLVAPPPGYEQVVGEQFEELKKQFESEEEAGGSLDVFYYAGDGSEQIFIAHASADTVMLVSFGGSDDPPETENLKEMEDYVNSNRRMLEDELEKVYRDIAPETETILMEAVQLEKDGFCGIHMSARIPLGEGALLQDRVLFYKDGVTYAAAIQNVTGESNADNVNYLLENLYFE